MSVSLGLSSFIFTTFQLISVQSMPTFSVFSEPMFEHHFSVGQNMDNDVRKLSYFNRHSEIQNQLHQGQGQNNFDHDTTVEHFHSDENIVQAARHHHARRSLLSEMARGYDELETKSRKVRSCGNHLTGRQELNTGIEIDSEIFFQDASKFFGIGSW